MTSIKRFACVSGFCAVVALGLMASSESSVQAQTPPRTLRSGPVVAPPVPRYEHIDEQALKVRRQAGRLAGEVRSVYRRHPLYRSLKSDTLELFYLADRTHETIHEGGDINRIAEDVRELDSVFHNLEGIVEEMQDTQTSYDRGRSRPREERVDYDFGRLQSQLAAIDDSLHHLRDDVRDAQTPRRPPERPREPQPSLEFGNGRLRLRLD